MLETIRSSMSSATGPAAKEYRFEVALSFPSEHRGRVEKIAAALAKRLGKRGKEKVL